ncbi:MAG TPA: hypothetical protein VFJ24_12285, partial [Gaiellales bacterium]|nr:hypothetical protein [Gaiellales bacterium]
MLRHTAFLAGLALLAGALGCSDRPPGTGPLPNEPPVSPASSPTTAVPAPPEALARALALALADPAFRAHVKAQLDASPYREHKLQFQR